MKSESTQTTSSAIPRIYSKLPPPEFEFPQILYQSHTVFWLLLSLCLFGYIFTTREDGDYSTNTRQGLFAIMGLMVFLGAMHFPDSEMMSRPHPAMWRMLMGLEVAYACLLLFLMFFRIEEARQLMKWFSQELGVELPEREYATDCRIFTPENPDSYFANVRNVVLDCYIPAHAIGWWFKMIIIRDVKLCTFLSLFFEFMEISLSHQLPNFCECWWDSVILDLLVCNGGGIYLGYLTCRYFEMKEYHWGVGRDSRNENERFSSVPRPALQFMPYSWSVHRWKIFDSCKNFVTTVWYIVFVNMVDLSNFYLKHLLWIPASHWLLLLRVLFWAVYAIIATREYYEYVQSGFTIRLGSHCWLSQFLQFLEWSFIIKNSKGIFLEPMPVWIQYVWTLIITFVVTTTLLLFYNDLRNPPRTKHSK